MALRGWRRGVDLVLLVVAVVTFAWAIEAVVATGQAGFDWRTMGGVSALVVGVGAFLRRTYEPLIVGSIGLAVLGGLLARAWLLEAKETYSFYWPEHSPYLVAVEVELAASSVALLALLRILASKSARRGGLIAWCVLFHGLIWALILHSFGALMGFVDLGQVGARFEPVGWVWTGLGCTAGATVTACVVRAVWSRGHRALALASAILGAWLIVATARAMLPDWRTPDEHWEAWWYPVSTTAFEPRSLGELWLPVLMLTPRGDEPYVINRQYFPVDELRDELVRIREKMDADREWLLLFNQVHATVGHVGDAMRLASEADIQRVAFATKLPRAPRSWRMIVADLARSNGRLAILPIPPLRVGAELVLRADQPLTDLIEALDRARGSGTDPEAFWISD